ncbi:MAG: ribonucleoside-diphosphate reductase subunit alpha [Nanoarchaeota archaeon]
MDALMIVKRTGEVVEFDEARIRSAITKAAQASGQSIERQVIDELVEAICLEIGERFVDMYPNVENVQDVVEKHLMRAGLYDLSKAYILYRADRQKAREQEKRKNIERSLLGKLTVRKRDGRMVLFDIARVKRTIMRASKGFEDGISADLIAQEVIKNVFDGITTDDIERSLILATTAFIERDPAYNYVSARLFLQKLYKEVMGKSVMDDVLGIAYRDAFVRGIKEGVGKGIMDERLLAFDLDKLSYGLKLDRDGLFKYLGIQTLYERYFVAVDNVRLEIPQAFWMRVAMGLAIDEERRDQKALEFYEMLSTLRCVASTPTLFHAGLGHPQLSSCYLTTVMDDLTHIFKSIGDNAQLSKWSGGLGNDWSNIRATGSIINSTKVESQGVIPFLKIASDVTAAINRSGKRRGATCAYLETWHLDIDAFLDLRRNTGDERRRTHDMNTSNWIPDLFMKRVIADEQWTLFSPEEVPDLHHIYGRAFEKRYVEYERLAREGKMRKHKIVSALKLWRKMLGRLFETGHPWMTFKDPCNIRSPQDHVGVIHSSNLCTEITLNTSAQETAVCNLGSINLERHVVDGRLDEDLLARTVKVAMRMLDNVIDVNFYPTPEAKDSNMLHRPVGLGIMGFQDALFKLNVNFDSQEAVSVADSTMEMISYHAILASSELAREKGKYPSFAGSKWDRGIFPVDTLDLLESERGIKVEVSRQGGLDWTAVRRHVAQFGMRNSNTMAVAPTATIANIAGCYPCIEPIYKNIYVKSNISGEFTVVNEYLIEDLKRLNLWNQDMLERLKYYDGNLDAIKSIPDNIKLKYREVFQIDPVHLVKVTAHRGKWIDQSQSHNVFMQGVSGNTLHETYLAAWRMGLKTTYYLRTLAASQIEKSTLDASKFGFTQKRQYVDIAESGPQSGKDEVKACLIEDPECEACQ